MGWQARSEPFKDVEKMTNSVSDFQYQKSPMQTKQNPAKPARKSEQNDRGIGFRGN
jgi:hypothetical protein